MKLLAFIIAYALVGVITMTCIGVADYRRFRFRMFPDWEDFMPAFAAGLFWPVALIVLLAIKFVGFFGYACMKLSDLIDLIEAKTSEMKSKKGTCSDDKQRDADGAQES